MGIQTDAQKYEELNYAGFHCNFETLWDIEVYDAAKAEFFLHETLYKCRVRYEFFRIDSERARQLAERFFDSNWRDIEGMDKDRPNLVELANLDAQGILMESDVSFDSDDGRVRQTKDDEPNFWKSDCTPMWGAVLDYK